PHTGEAQSGYSFLKVHFTIAVKSSGRLWIITSLLLASLAKKWIVNLLLHIQSVRLYLSHRFRVLIW
ncbi:MAG: hypothetical protein ACHQ1H_11145, partial [Nitrososphaerales archaeon]